MFLAKKWGILIKKESESLVFTGLEIPRDYYTGKEAWINRILAIVAALFILAIMIVIIVEVIKRYKRMWDEISQMFLVGSLSGIAVLGDIIRGYLPVNLILLFGFINVGIMLLRVYLQKKFDYL